MKTYLKNKYYFFCVSLLLATFLVAPVAAQEPDSEIRELELAFNQAYEKNALDDYFGYYADDATMWLNAGWQPLAGYRQDWYQMIGAGGGVESNVISDLRVQMGPGDTTAVATYQLDVRTRMPDGSITQEHAHESDVWFKREGQWKIVHVHYTVEAPE